MRFCKDCAHVMNRRHELDADTAKCGAEPNRSGYNLVTGSPTYYNLAIVCRSTDTLCGTEGNWFKQYIQLAPLPNAIPKNTVAVKGKILDLGDMGL